MRTAVKIIGLTLLVPSLVLALAPLIATYTNFMDALPALRIGAMGHTIFEIRTIAHGVVVTTSPLVWGVAAAGEGILILMQILSPKRHDVNRLTVRG